MTNVGTEERAAAKKIATTHREKNEENLVQRLRPTSSFSVLVNPGRPGEGRHSEKDVPPRNAELQTPASLEELLHGSNMVQARWRRYDY